MRLYLPAQTLEDALTLMPEMKTVTLHLAELVATLSYEAVLDLLFPAPILEKLLMNFKNLE